MYICTYLDVRLIADLEQDHRRQLPQPICLGVFRAELLRVTEPMRNVAHVKLLAWLFFYRAAESRPVTFGAVRQRMRRAVVGAQAQRRPCRASATAKRPVAQAQRPFLKS